MCTSEWDGIGKCKRPLEPKIISKFRNLYTVEPPNKGHFGDSINSAVLSFVERLSSSRRFKMY